MCVHQCLMREYFPQLDLLLISSTVGYPDIHLFNYTDIAICYQGT